MPSRTCPTCSETFPDTRNLCPNDGDLLISAGEQGKRSGEVLRERFRLGLKIGAGGMAVVYEATRLEDDKQVAIKLLRPEAVEDQGLERFRREAEAGARLNHPGFVKALEWHVEAGDDPFIAFEKLHGHTLDQVRRAGLLVDAERSVDLLKQTAQAVQAAHELGIVHRDLKPSNIFVHRPSPEESVIKVLDFGVAKFQDIELDRLTRTDQFLGTPLYAAPEQTSNGESTPAADVYSLGTILFEALSGRLPIKGSGILDLIRRLNQEPAPPISLYRTDLPESLEKIIERCLLKRPRDRFANAGALAEALGEVRLDQTLGAPTEPRPAADPRAILGSVIAEQYAAQEWLGPGRFGSQVYRAEHLRAETSVAVRLWTPEDRRAMSALIDAFRSEARAMSVRHPNLITILDLGYDDDKVYLVTEYVESISLRVLLEEQRSLATERCLGLMRPIISALAALHEGGIISGALTPETIRITGKQGAESPLVSPFGLSDVRQIKLIAGAKPDHLRSIFLDYLAPEQRRGQPATAHSDVYTLALIFVELLRGCPGDKDATLTEFKPDDTSFDLTRLGLGETWRGFLKQSLSDDAGHRFSTASEMLQEFDRLAKRPTSL